jgi:hypothetical protein
MAKKISWHANLRYIWQPTIFNSSNLRAKWQYRVSRGGTMRWKIGRNWAFYVENSECTISAIHDNKKNVVRETRSKTAIKSSFSHTNLSEKCENCDK